jgi:hypothetical protein
MSWAAEQLECRTCLGHGNCRAEHVQQQATLWSLDLLKMIFNDAHLIKIELRKACMIQWVHNFVECESNSDMRNVGKASSLNSIDDVEDGCDISCVDAQDVGTTEARFPSVNTIGGRTSLHCRDSAATSIKVIEEDKTGGFVGSLDVDGFIEGGTEWITAQFNGEGIVARDRGVGDESRSGSNGC